MPATLTDHLRHRLADAGAPSGALCVAYSGGPDSSALLHALAGLPEARARGLRALHVDHGLQAASTGWARHCLDRCAGWDVPCEALRVQVALDRGRGLEAAARHARYQALAARLAPGENLLLAHHRDDQAETVLLKLLRGAGPEGLGGMRERRPLGAGTLWRPLLALPRSALAAHVHQHGLSCIDDPSNADTRLARNHLRAEILPRLLEAFPQAVDSIVHSAALSRDAADALREAWLAAFATLHDPASGSLDAAGWRELAPALRQPLLDHWLHAQGLPAPTTAQRRQLERQTGAQQDRVPCVRWPGAEVHRWRGRWWATPPLAAPPPGWQAAWRGEPLALPGGGRLYLAAHDGRPAPTRLAQPLTVRLRHGGEVLKPVGDAHTRELRDLFQQGALPPWLRPRCPLIYEGERLLAVADRWRDARAETLFAEAGARPCWQAFD